MKDLLLRLFSVSKMSEDLKNCCRLCLDVNSAHVSILHDPVVQLHLKSCLAITITSNDPLPKVICSSCVAQLCEFYNFILSAKCSQDWLESSLVEKNKHCTETKTPIQPLPDSEYNSDSLLEFLNNTANIEEYLSNLGRDDISTIAGMLNENNDASESTQKLKKSKESPQKKGKDYKLNSFTSSMEIDILDSDIEIVKDLLLKETAPKIGIALKKNVDKSYICFACKLKFIDIGQLSKHLSCCDLAVRTCVHCGNTYDSKKQMLEHYITHTSLNCVCGRQFDKKMALLKHAKICNMPLGTMKCVFKCKQCGRVFKERNKLYKHARDHVLKSVKKICDICGHDFIGNKLLKQHKKDVHNISSDLKYRCKVCSFTAVDHKQVYLHVSKHVAQEENHHLCETCGCSFLTRSSLNRHCLTHSNKEYICNICGRKFVNEQSRDAHIEYHNEVMCEKCGVTALLGTHKC